MSRYSSQLVRGADNLVRWEGPVNEITGAAITNTPAVTSAKCRLFDDGKDTVLEASETLGQTIISVERPGLFEVGVDRAVIQLDSGAWHDGGLILGRSIPDKTLTISVSLAAGASKGARVGRPLGAAIGSSDPWEIDMTYYEPASGAVAGNFDYGWRATIPDTQANGFDIGTICRIELVLDVSAGVKGLKTLKRRIVGGV